MNTPCITYDNKLFILTHDMTLHITHCLPDDSNMDFQKMFSKNINEKHYFLELAHMILTKLISDVPDGLLFKLYVYQIPSSMISQKFAKDAFKILKPLILHHEETRYTYERYLAGKENILDGDEEEEDDKEETNEVVDKEEEEKNKKEEHPPRSIFDLSYSDEEEYNERKRIEEEKR